MAALRSSGHYASYFPSCNFQVDVPPTSNTLLRREAGEGSDGGLSLPPLLAAVIFKLNRRHSARQGPIQSDKQEEAGPAAEGATWRTFTCAQIRLFWLLFIYLFLFDKSVWRLESLRCFAVHIDHKLRLSQMDVDIVSHKVMTTRFQRFYQIHRYGFSKSGSEKDPEVMKFTESLN